MKKPWNSINFALLIVMFIISSNLPTIAACVDMDGDGTAETCIGGNSGGGGNIPMPSNPSPPPQSNESSGSTSSSHSTKPHSSSIYNNWQQNSDMIDSWISEFKLKAAQQKLLKEKQQLEAQILEAKKKEEEAKKKAEAQAKKQHLDFKTAENKNWLENIENKNKKPLESTNEDLTGKIKLLRDPSLYNTYSMSNPKSDQRVADVERLKLKKATNPSQNKAQPAYFGPDPKTLNDQELQYQIKLLDSQIAGCQTNASLKCSPQFVNMLTTEKQKYLVEYNSKTKNTSFNETNNESISSKIKHIDNENYQNPPIQKETSGRTGNTVGVETIKKLNIKGKYNLK